MQQICGLYQGGWAPVRRYIAVQHIAMEKAGEYPPLSIPQNILILQQQGVLVTPPDPTSRGTTAPKKASGFNGVFSAAISVYCLRFNGAAVLTAATTCRLCCKCPDISSHTRYYTKVADVDHLPRRTLPRVSGTVDFVCYALERSVIDEAPTVNTEYCVKSRGCLAGSLSASKVSVDCDLELFPAQTHRHHPGIAYCSCYSN